MKQFLFFVLLGILFFVGCTSNKKNTQKSTSNKDTIFSVSQNNVTIKRYTYKELAPLLSKKNDSIYVVNFWATWCKPCVKELPVFDKLQQEYAHKKVFVLLVSLDFPKLIDAKVNPFIQKRNIKSKVVLLDEGKEDLWIKAISEKWSGAIPATLIYSKNRRKFYEQSFSYLALETELQSFLK